MNFQSLLNMGIEYEEKVLKTLKRKYPLATRIEGQFVDYDIWVPELHKSVEVKYDKKSEQTNNIIIEYERNNKPGDILTTKASYWCIHTASGFLWIKPIKIIECILREDCKDIKVNNAKCYLIPIITLHSYSIRGSL
jgi:hypothetical protein